MTEIIKRNLGSGVVVFFVALPLCLGIALAQGAPLFAGLVSGIIGGIVIGALGASKISVSGPAAGLTVVVLGAITKLGGFEVFTLAVLASGCFQVVFALLRLGVVSKFIPGSVIKGMLAAIGIIIFLKQIPHLFGYDADYVGDIQFEQTDGQNTFSELLFMLNRIQPTALLISALSLLVMIYWEKKVTRQRPALKIIPGSIVAVVIAVIINELTTSKGFFKTLDVTHLVQVPQNITWSAFGENFKKVDFSLLWKNSQIYTVALTIAIIGSIETLLSLEAADKMDSERKMTNKNRELYAQGAGNILSGFLGGLPITAVIVRTVTNVNSGANHRLSAIWHGILLVIAVFFIPGILNKIPLAVLAAVLALVGYKLSSRNLFKAQYRAGREEFIPFMVTVLAVVFTDILLGVGIGFAFSIGFIIFKNYRKGFFTAKSGDQLVIKLENDINFIHRPSLSEELREVPDGSTVILQAEKIQRLNHDIAEVIEDFREDAVGRNIKIIERNMPYMPPEEVTLKGKSAHMYQKLLHGNKNWVAKCLETDRGYFEDLAKGQSPSFMWIGCADSRVPPNEVTQTRPGEIFIHRNVANMVVHTDLNMLSVLQYAVEVLKVKHVIVCGHYECGGIRAALGNQSLGLANKWLRNIKEVYQKHENELGNFKNVKDRENRLVELNVIESVRNLGKTSIVQKAWKNREVELHGWVIDLKSGHIKELDCKVDGPEDLAPIFRYKL